MQCRKRVTSGDSLKPTGKPTVFQNQSMNRIRTSQVKQSQQEIQQIKEGDLRKSIVCFRKYLNESVESIRNGTIQQENQQNEISFEEQLNQDLHLFYEFLECRYETAEDKLLYYNLLSQMDSQYNKINSPEKNLLLSIQPVCLNYFISVWLESMGFLQSENRRRVTRNISRFLKTKVSLNIIQQTYDSLFLQYLPHKLHLTFLLELCRRGWQYFTFFAVKFLIYIKQCYTQDISETEWRKIQTIIHE